MEQNGILNAAKAHVDGAARLEVGTWLGRRQAFGLIANKRSAADATKLCRAPGAPGKSGYRSSAMAHPHRFGNAR